MELHWDTSNHDVVRTPSFSMALGEMPTYLAALLMSEGTTFLAPYPQVRENILVTLEASKAARETRAQAPTAEVTPQRLRTWKKVFEEAGFLYVDSATKTLHNTRLGSEIRHTFEALQGTINEATKHVSSLALRVLCRQRLKNPMKARDYPEDCDIRPFRTILSLARNLDNKVHWEEVNRVITRVLRESEINAALALIREVRPSSGVYDQEALDRLGVPVADDRRRITPILSEAGFGGTFLKDDENGYWSLVEGQLAAIDEVLSLNETMPEGILTPEDYLQYLDAGMTERTEPAVETGVFQEVLNAVDSYGTSKIIALSGLPGTGKTRLARDVALALVEGDPYRLAEVQFHESTGYDQFVEGYVPRADGSGFELRQMTLIKINEKALADASKRPYVLIIEEFTRADIHSVLGEFLTYVEHRNRPFRLSYSQTDTHIAENLVVIATMNPHDRSAVHLDNAVKRRLFQIEVPPSPEVMEKLVSGLEESSREKLMRWYRNHHSTLPFGHGEFAGVGSEDDLRSIWRGTLRYFLMDVTGNVSPLYATAVDEYPWN